MGIIRQKRAGASNVTYPGGRGYYLQRRTTFKRRKQRKYPCVKHEMLGGEKEFIARYNASKKKFAPDIKELFYHHGYLWVKTSLEDKDKGFLFDLFDSAGQFSDSSFINLDGYIIKIDGDFLYSSEHDEDGRLFVVKYRIMEPMDS